MSNNDYMDRLKSIRNKYTSPQAASVLEKGSASVGLLRKENYSPTKDLRSSFEKNRHLESISSSPMNYKFVSKGLETPQHEMKSSIYHRGSELSSRRT